MTALQSVLCNSLLSLVLISVTLHTDATSVALGSELLDACKDLDYVRVQELIKIPGVDVNEADEAGNTPLIIACQQGHADILKTLLSLKKSDGSYAVKVNQANKDGITPLLMACKMHNHFKVKILLAVPGIDVNQVSNDGESPLLEACKNNGCNFNLEIIDALLKKGADNRANKKGETPLGVTKGTLLYSLLVYHLGGKLIEERAL